VPPRRASFSSRWPGIDVYASGTRVLGPTVWDGVAGWGRWSGTSFAAATVSGILARERSEHPDWRAWLAHRPSVEGKPYLKSRELGALGYVGGAGVG
jgi:subtilisin family serine protease